MKILLTVFVLLFGCGVMAQEPCVRMAELVTKALEWARHDRYLGRYTNWRARADILNFRHQALNHTGIDILSEDDRRTFICRALNFERLREVYDFFSATPMGPEIREATPYGEMCEHYKELQERFRTGHIAEVNMGIIGRIETVAKELATWLEFSGFPDSFPILGDHQDHVNALQDIVDLGYGESGHGRHITYAVRSLLTKLLPIEQPNIAVWGHKSKAEKSVEEIVTKMKSSRSLFAYADFIQHGNGGWFDVGDLKESHDLLLLIKNNYDNIKWYREAVTILLKSNLYYLDTSDCPESGENQQNNDNEYV